MDKLKEMLAAQLELQKALGYNFDTMTVSERTAYIKEYTAFTIDELYEVMRELPFYKPWKKYADDDSTVIVQYANARAEFADVLHFILNIALALGLSAEDIQLLFNDKHEINYARQTNTTEYKPCVVNEVE